MIETFNQAWAELEKAADNVRALGNPDTLNLADPGVRRTKKNLVAAVSAAHRAFAQLDFTSRQLHLERGQLLELLNTAAMLPPSETKRRALPSSCTDAGKLARILAKKAYHTDILEVV